MNVFTFFNFQRLDFKSLSLLLLLFLPSFAMCLTSTSKQSTLPFSQRPYDLIVYGATGFTGQLAAEYIYDTYHGKIKYALAGRNPAKLQALRSRLLSSSTTQPEPTQHQEEEIPILIADAQNDPTSLQSLAASTKVIANYAGSPFLDKALPVVKACVQHGTCYTDITGEVPFQRASQDLYHKAALESASLIVHSCGYDSIPSDIGAYLAAKALQERNTPCNAMELVAGDSRGGVSGGTLYTAMEIIAGGEKHKDIIPSWKTSLIDHESPTNNNDNVEQDTVSFVTYDKVANSWVMPFFMAAANAPVVRKSIAVLGYGPKCTYREVMAVPNFLAGMAGTLALVFGGLSIVFPPTRWFLKQFILPKPGQGPSRQERDAGYFTSHVYATGTNPVTGETVTTRAHVKSGSAGDPGYKGTALMSVEASLCLALERDLCLKEGGVVTPAIALGDTLVKRLNQAGMELGVEDDSTRITSAKKVA